MNEVVSEVQALGGNITHPEEAQPPNWSYCVQPSELSQVPCSPCSSLAPMFQEPGLGARVRVKSHINIAKYSTRVKINSTN